jgi:hypothetical protein
MNVVRKRRGIRHLSIRAQVRPKNIVDQKAS